MVSRKIDSEGFANTVEQTIRQAGLPYQREVAIGGPVSQRNHRSEDLSVPGRTSITRPVGSKTETSGRSMRSYR